MGMKVSLTEDCGLGQTSIKICHEGKIRKPRNIRPHLILWRQQRQKMGPRPRAGCGRTTILPAEDTFFGHLNFIGHPFMTSALEEGVGTGKAEVREVV